VDPLQLPRHDLDPLVLFGGRLPRVGEISRQEQPHPLVREAGARVEGEQLLPLAGLLADLLGQLTLARRQWLLALDVELTGGDLERGALADRLARLPGQPQMGIVDRHDPNGPGVPDLLARDLLAVGVAEALLAGPDELALPE